MSPSKPRHRADVDEADEAAVIADATAQVPSSETATDDPDGVAVDDSALAPDGEGLTKSEYPAEHADLLAELVVVGAERDDYLNQLQRQQAEFQNYRRRAETERRQQVAAGVSRLVESLLPVLDGCDAATAQGHIEVSAVGQSLMVALGKAGLERIDAVGEPFDPTQHEAVTIEEAPAVAGPSEPSAEQGDADTAVTGDDASRRGGSDPHDRQIVAEELRSGFRFDGRVLRAAMVKVRTG